MVLNMRTNTSVLFAHRQSQQHLYKKSKALERLSSGYRINSVADDPAGLYMSEKMRAQIRGLGVAKENVKRAMKMIDTTDGDMDEVTSILQRMRELAVRANDATLSDADRGLLDVEYQSLLEELNRVATAAQKEALKENIQIGANSGETYSPYAGLLAGNLDSIGGTNLLTTDGSQNSLDAVDNLIRMANADRAGYGADLSVLEHILNSIESAEYNLIAAESTIRDADMAKEMVNFMKASILLQASQAMMAQAMKDSSSIVDLLTAL